MKIIKTKPQNASVIADALTRAGFDAKIIPLKDLDRSQWIDYVYFDFPDSDWDGNPQSLVRFMVPLQISCSGTQANKIIQSLRDSGDIS